MAWTQTYTGRQFHPDAPERTDFNIEDIAHALSMTCRFAGSTKFHYSVAQHSVLVADWLYAETGHPFVALDGLMHDAAEAYLVDMPSPIKALLPDYAALEDRVDKALRLAFAPFGVPSKKLPLTRSADARIIEDERIQLLRPCREPWSTGFTPLGVYIYQMTPARAKDLFLDKWEQYAAEVPSAGFAASQVKTEETDK